MSESLEQVAARLELLHDELSAAITSVGMAKANLEGFLSKTREMQERVALLQIQQDRRDVRW